MESGLLSPPSLEKLVVPVGYLRSVRVLLGEGGSGISTEP